jgi:hypothetical protein
MLRKSVNLTDRDLERLAPYFEKQSEERRLLAEAVGEDAATYSDSAVLRELALLGAQTLMEKAMEEGYRKYAEIPDPDRDAWIQMSARAIAENIRREERGS